MIGVCPPPPHPAIPLLIVFIYTQRWNEGLLSPPDGQATESRGIHGQEVMVLFFIFWLFFVTPLSFCCAALYCTRYRVVLHRAALYCTVLSCPVVSCPSCPVLSCQVRPCVVISYPMLSYLILRSHDELLNCTLDPSCNASLYR